MIIKQNAKGSLINTLLKKKTRNFNLELFPQYGSIFNIQVQYKEDTR